MAIRPEEMDEANAQDTEEVRALEELIDQELRNLPKEDEPKDSYKLTIRRGGKSEPNYLVKRMLREKYIEAGWEDIAFRYEEVSAPGTYWEELIVTLKRKI